MISRNCKFSWTENKSL